MHVRFARLAVQELADAKEWYEAQQKGLGQIFAHSVRESALRIARVPLLYPIEVGDVRRCVLNRHPALHHPGNVGRHPDCFASSPPARLLDRR
jgi:hypothetical protein